MTLKLTKSKNKEEFMLLIWREMEFQAEPSSGKAVYSVLRE